MMLEWAEEMIVIGYKMSFVRRDEAGGGGRALKIDFLISETNTALFLDI